MSIHSMTFFADTLRSLAISELLRAYRSGVLTPAQFFSRLLNHIDTTADHHTFITRLTREQVFAYVDRLQANAMTSLPLYGIPFVIKDNIDLAGILTTAGCPAFAYTPDKSATVVQQLIDAGAIPLGKANMDQFATGLVGTRSPYGAGQNSFNREYISGGSSSGSALAVALGFASFALGTDTAGSGRVPAAYNNLIGLKPSCGRLSTQGMVPACRSIDCISIFALTAEDAATVLAVAEGFDGDDPWSKPAATSMQAGRMMRASLHVGIPQSAQLQFFGDDDYAQLFAEVCAVMRSQGATLVELDFTPLLFAAKLLYEGPWVAERYAAIESLLESNPDAVHPVTREITLQACGKTAVQAFKAQYQMQTLRRAGDVLLAQADLFMTPTAGTIYRIAEVNADPIRLNSNLGYYTNFMNLLDLAAVSAPAGFRRDGLPFGITLFAARDTDYALLRWADRVQRTIAKYGGANKHTMPDITWPALLPEHMPIAVCGAHMEGLPLNHQLISRHAYLLERTATAPEYRFYALPGGPPHRPGLVRVNEHGVAIEVEVWAVHQSQWGAFMAQIPAPLCLGRIQLASGQWVTGFLCEAAGVASAFDISDLGSWRKYLSQA
jgi:allophanate hydrolase